MQSDNAFLTRSSHTILHSFHTQKKEEKKSKESTKTTRPLSLLLSRLCLRTRRGVYTADRQTRQPNTALFVSSVLLLLRNLLF
jgi:hypothetical protein